MGFARTTVEVVYGIGDAFSGIGYAMILFGILVGGAITWYLFTMLLEYVLLYSERKTKLFLQERTSKYTVWRKQYSNWTNNLRHLIVQVLFFAGLALIVWLAASVIGLNVWTSAAASLGISVVVTYSFATPLGLYGSALFVNGAALVSVGEYVEFFGTGSEWAGTVVAIHSTQVEMVRVDTKTKRGEVIWVPISDFLSRMRKSIVKEDYEPSMMAVRDADSLKTTSSRGSSKNRHRRTAEEMV
jgi:hypothetical protein